MNGENLFGVSLFHTVYCENTETHVRWGRGKGEEGV